MNEQSLIDSLAASCSQLPGRVDVIALQQLSLDELRGRAQRFLSQLQEQDECAHDRADWVVRGEQTVIQLAQGARAVVYHASGALQYISGMTPLQGLFERMEDREQLTRLVNAAAARLDIASWAGTHGQLVFENLFQMKAQGMDREGKRSDPVLARAIGAYRQTVGGIPVLGAASVALKLAGDGQLDALSVLARPTSAEVIDKASLIEPELAARQIALLLSSVLGQARERLPSDAIESQSLQFGYLDLGKRKSQRLLAPAFVARIVVRHNTNRQAYVFAVPASEKTYMAIPPFGTEAPVMHSRIGGDCRELQR
jgi:hypothetical protein